jgi:hypothetical protein
MSENPTEGGLGSGVPDAPPPGAVADPKRKLNGGFFVLGLLTPWAVSGLTAIPLSIFGANGTAVGLAGLSLLPLIVLVAQLVAWLVGRSNGNNRLRSWGLGGMASLAVTTLAGLLFFGACMLTLNGNNMLG